jgi:hypothetical protein
MVARWIPVLCALVLVAGTASGAVVVGNGQQMGNSGWAVFYDEAVGSVVLDNDLDPLGDGKVILQLSKTFNEPFDPQSGQFPPIFVTFEQVVATQAVSQIVIDNEVMVNNTGLPWTDFEWIILDKTDAWFDEVASANFSVDPFGQKQFIEPDGSQVLMAYGGTVLDSGQTFTPGIVGNLVIDMVVADAAPLTAFTLKQLPTPEPVTAFMLALGLGWVVRRRGR